jgi:hypothetical protein
MPSALRRVPGPEQHAACVGAAALPRDAKAAPAAAPTAAPVCLDQVATVNARCEKWARAFNDRSPDGSIVKDVPAAMAVSRRGDRMFVATTTSVGSAQPRLTVAALSTAAGATVWVAHPPTPQSTSAVALTLTPDGKTVIVTGTTVYLPNLNAAPLIYWLTSAYATSNGRHLWSAVYRLGGSVNMPVAVRTSPRGDRVFVTGYSVYTNYARAYVEWVTVAYSARGKQLWLQRYGGAAGGQNVPVGLAVAPRGDLVYVGGSSEHAQKTGSYSWDYAVAAYDARTGRLRWRTLTRGGTNHIPVALSITPRGDRVLLTGTAVYGTATSPVAGLLTVAHSPRTGARLWTTRYLDASGQSASATAMTLSPRGDRAYVTAAVGQRRTVVEGTVEPTVQTITLFALDTSSGRQAWTWGYAPDPNYSAAPVAATVNPATGAVYVSGVFGPPSLVATYPLTLSVTAVGKTAWVARYDLRDPGAAGTAVGGFPSNPVAIATDGGGKNVYTSIAYFPVGTGAAAKECDTAHSAGVDQDCRAGGESDLILAFAR